MDAIILNDYSWIRLLNFKASNFNLYFLAPMFFYSIFLQMQIKRECLKIK